MQVRYEESPLLGNDELDALWAVAWPRHSSRDFQPVLARSLAYVVARDEGKLVGFVNVACDGGEHGFLLDPTVHPAYRRRGIGSELVRRAAAVARERGLTWLHVDFAPELAAFYDKAGFLRTQAGLMRLRPER